MTARSSSRPLLAIFAVLNLLPVSAAAIVEPESDTLSLPSPIEDLATSTPFVARIYASSSEGSTDFQLNLFRRKVGEISDRFAYDGSGSLIEAFNEVKEIQRLRVGAINGGDELSFEGIHAQLDADISRAIRFSIPVAPVENVTLSYTLVLHDGTRVESGDVRTYTEMLGERVSAGTEPPPGCEALCPQGSLLVAEWLSGSFWSTSSQGRCGVAAASGTGDLRAFARATPDCADGWGNARIITRDLATIDRAINTHRLEIRVSDDLIVKTDASGIALANASLLAILHEHHPAGGGTDHVLPIFECPTSPSDCAFEGQTPVTIAFNFAPKANHKYGVSLRAHASGASYQCNGCLFGQASAAQALVDLFHVVWIRVQEVIPDSITGTTITSAPTTVEPGQVYRVCWSVSGTGDITHTHLHWGTSPGAHLSSTAVQTGSAAATFCAEDLVAPQSGTIYLVSHAVGPRDDRRSPEVTIRVESPPAPPGTRPPENGAGGQFDTSRARVGHLFAGVPSGTLTQVCLYMRGGSGSVHYRVTSGSVGSSTSSFVFEGNIQARAANGWVCEAMSRSWSASNLLIYYESGAGEVAWRDAHSGGSMVGIGSSWEAQPGYDRGFGFTLDPDGGSGEAPRMSPPENGSGSGWDTSGARVGQLFTGVPSGTLTKVCLYLQGNSGRVNYRVSNGGIGSSTSSYVLAGSVTAGSADGWACQAGLAVAWSWTTLIVYYESGPGKVGYRSVPAPKGGSMVGIGTTWVSQADHDRGFGFTLEVGGGGGGGGGSPTTAPPANGAGSGWDTSRARVGQLFRDVPPGTITKVCLYMEAGSGTVTYRASSGGVGSSTSAFVFGGAITAGQTHGWACQSGLDQPWSAGTLLLYYEPGGGSGNVAYRGPVSGGGSMVGIGSSWESQPDYDRGFGFSLTSGGGGGGSVTLVPPNAGAGSGFDTGAPVGQLFDGVPSGTITQVCAYMEGGTGSVTYGVSPHTNGNPTAPADTFTGTLTAGSTSGWSCGTLAQPWSAGQLFVHYRSGPGKIAYRQVDDGSGQSHQGLNGATWQRQPDYDRGYKIVIATA